MAFERELRDLSWVPRWSIIRTSRAQSVAEHSYYVAVYSISIAKLIRWDEATNTYPHEGMIELIETALYHDIEESFTGDIPGPMKRQMGEEGLWREIVRGERNKRFGSRYSVSGNSEILAIVKVADILDEVLFLAGELQRGNMACGNIFNMATEGLIEHWNKLPAPREVLDKTWNVVVSEAISREIYGYSMGVGDDNAQADPRDRGEAPPEVTQAPWTPPDWPGPPLQDPADPLRVSPEEREAGLDPHKHGYKDLSTKYQWLSPILWKVPRKT